MRFHLKGMLLLAASLVSLGAVADNVTTLELVQNSGDTVQFALSASPVITTSNNQLVITAGTQKVEVSLSDVKLYHFLTDTATGINKTTDNQSATRSFNDGMVSFSGLKAFSSIIVATVDGKLVANVKADASGRASIDLNAYGHGLYIIKSTTGSFKINF